MIKNNRYRPGITKDRRKGPDKLTNIIQYFGFSAWCILIVGLALIEKARPTVEQQAERGYKVALNTNWNLDLIRYMFYLMILGIFVSMAGIVLNSMRLKRRTDELRMSILFLAVISLGTILYYIIFVN